MWDSSLVKVLFHFLNRLLNKDNTYCERKRKIYISELMEWTNDKILSFISDIERLPILWNSSDPYYKINRKKDETWQDLASRFCTTIIDVQKKWRSLQASYRREKFKIIHSKESEKKVSSKWFAYRAMTFLGEHSKPRRTTNVSEMSEACQQEENSDHKNHEDINEIEAAQTILHTPERNLRLRNNRQLRNISLRKKYLKIFHSSDLSSLNEKKINKDNELNEMYILKTVAEKESQRDENETYGEYVALTLKKLDDYSRIMTKHYINEILIKAELGKYKDSIL